MYAEIYNGNICSSCVKLSKVDDYFTDINLTTMSLLTLDDDKTITICPIGFIFCVQKELVFPIQLENSTFEHNFFPVKCANNSSNPYLAI